MKIRNDIQLTSLRVPGIIICASALVLNTSLVNSGSHTECICCGFNGNLKIYKDVPVSKIGIYPSNALAQVSSEMMRVMMLYRRNGFIAWWVANGFSPWSLWREEGVGVWCVMMTWKIIDVLSCFSSRQLLTEGFCRPLIFDDYWSKLVCVLFYSFSYFRPSKESQCFCLGIYSFIYSSTYNCLQRFVYFCVHYVAPVHW